MSTLRKSGVYWIAIVLGIVALQALAPIDGLADGSALSAGYEYAIGYYSPDEQVEHIMFVGVAVLEAQLQATVDMGSFEEEVIRLFNEVRQAEGLHPLKGNDLLAVAADKHSVVMRDQNCFSHQCTGEMSSAGRACAEGYGAYGWGACYTGETLAAGFKDPASVVAAWMESPGHHDIIMHPLLREVGIGYVEGGYYGTYWTADFGSQPNVLPVFINRENAETENQQVLLTLTNEEVSGDGGIDFASQVMISNRPDFIGAQWTAYTPQKPWTLSDGSGPKTVYVKYRDDSGVETVSTDDIRLNLPAQYDLELGIHTLSFIYKLGEGFKGASEGSVQVINAAGDYAMTWNASSEISWVGIESSGGVTPGSLFISLAEFEASVPGTWQTTITVVSPEDPGNSEEVTVTVRVVEEIHRILMPLAIKSR